MLSTWKAIRGVRRSTRKRRCRVAWTAAMLLVIVAIFNTMPSRPQRGGSAIGCVTQEAFHRDALAHLDSTSAAAHSNGSEPCSQFLAAVDEGELDAPACARHQRHPAGHLSIPRVLVQTGRHTCVPKEMFRGSQSMLTTAKQKDVALVHYFFTDEMMRNFTARHCGISFDGGEVLRAFDMLIPGAFRADIFRYCFLYAKGGVYLDLGMHPSSPTFDEGGHLRRTMPFMEMISMAESAGVGLVSAEDNEHGFAYNALLAAVPCHPVLRITLEEAAKRVRSRFYTTEDYGALIITGPQLLRDAILKYLWGVDIDLESVRVRGLRTLELPDGRVNDVFVLRYRRPFHCLSGLIEFTPAALRNTVAMPRDVAVMGDVGANTHILTLWSRRARFCLVQIERFFSRKILRWFHGHRVEGNGGSVVVLHTKTPGYYDEAWPYFGSKHYGVLWSQGPESVYMSKTPL